MAILRSNDGKFYDVADDQLEDKLIPAEEVKERLGDVGVGSAPGPVGPGPEMAVPGTGGQVVVQIYTSPGDAGPPPPGPGPEGPPPPDVYARGWGHGHHFCNHWRRNCWRNHHCHW